MDKRSFNVMLTMVIGSMLLIGTYKITKKKANAAVKNISAVDKDKK